MILELDCGNSLIKWRVITPAGELISSGLARGEEGLINAFDVAVGPEVLLCRLVSVRSSEETGRLVRLIKSRFSVDTLCAQPAKELGGVRNGYSDFRALGLDRWLALVGAYQRTMKACLVIDLGTAVTSDFLSSSGDHLGGFICPGIPLLRGQLKAHTCKIRYDGRAADGLLNSLQPGRSTMEAVERGCQLMLLGFVKEQIEIARRYWQEDFDLYLTGGDAGLLSDDFPKAKVMSDLVFAGLALACPIP